ncbi:MAG: hypothetical protein RL712_1377 [Bacteroidota bacterium]
MTKNDHIRGVERIKGVTVGGFASDFVWFGMGADVVYSVGFRGVCAFFAVGLQGHEG